MNWFKVKKINPHRLITLVNVWSYKVRVAVCSFSFSSIKILGYWEKRQSRLDIVNNEINNITGVCETIKQAILKAEFKAWVKVDEIIINPFFTNTFYYSKTISYRNTNSDLEFWNEEVFEIISYVEDISIKSILREIEENFWFSIDDLSLILSNISDLNIDWNKVKTLYWEKWEDIKIKILNTFIWKTNYEIIENIAMYLDKKVLKIIPEEYAITKLWEKWKELVFIDIWNSSTSVSVKDKNDNLKWAVRLDVWIWDLVKEISKTYWKSRWEIIKRLDRDDLFKKEKENFLILFMDIIIEWLKDILSWDICPNNFIIVWWWANNIFIKDYFIKKDFNSLWVKMLKKVNFVSASIEEIRKITWVEDILNISNISIISQIITTNNILNSENDIMERALEKSIENTLN
jgi:preprotein translocase subunit SecE